MRLSVARMTERSQRSPPERGGLLFVIGRGHKSLIFSRWIGDSCVHEIYPDGQCGVPSGFVLTQLLLLVKTDPYSAGDAGRKADEPGVRVVIGSAGLTGHGMVQPASGT